MLKRFFTDKFSVTLTFLLYSLAIILLVFSMLNELGIISENSETINYLDELDFSIELPEIEQNSTISQEKISDNIINI
jgi:predicted PurR-regulated permease PerM